MRCVRQHLVDEADEWDDLLRSSSDEHMREVCDARSVAVDLR